MKQEKCSEKTKRTNANYLQLELTARVLLVRFRSQITESAHESMSAKKSLRTQLAFVFVLLLGGVLLFSIPVGLALEVHHLFSEIDHDGHEHAKHDLCTWVEHQVGGSYVQDCYRTSLSVDLQDFLPQLHVEWVYSSSRRIDQSRAPPLS